MKKRMGKSIFLKKVTVSVLAMAVLVSSVTGCGKKESSADVKSVNQIEEIDKDHFFKEEEIKGVIEEGSEDVYLDYVGGKIKCVYLDQAGKYKFVSANTDGTVDKSYEIPVSTNDKHAFFEMDESENLYMQYSDYESDESDQKTGYYLVKFDNTGKEAGREDLLSDAPANSMFSIEGVAWTKDNGLIISSSRGVEKYSEQDGLTCIIDPKLLHSFKNGGRLIKGSDEQLYIHSYNLDDSRLWKVDLANGKIGEPSKCFGENNADKGLSFSRGEGYGLYAALGNYIYGYDSKEDKITEIANLRDSDIGFEEGINRFIAVNEGEFWATFCKDNGGVYLSKLTKVNPEDVKEKTTVTLGGAYINSDIINEVHKFNKTNDEYRIQVIDYAEDCLSDDEADRSVEKFNLDILSGKAPDILAVSEDSSDISGYIDKGVLMDLGPLFDKGGALENIEFLPNVFEMMHTKDKIYTVFSRFTVNTLAIRKRFAEGRTSLSISDCEEIIDKTGVGYKAAFGSDSYKEGIIYCGVDFDKYLDPENGKCNFTDPDFIELLTFADKFPEQSEYDYGMFDEDRGYLEDKAIFRYSPLSNFRDYAMLKYGVFQDDISLVGCINSNSENSAKICPLAEVGINSKTKYKDAAVQFIKSMFENYDPSNIYSSFPSDKASFEAAKKAATQKRGEDDYFSLGYDRIKATPLTEAEVQELSNYILSIKNHDDNFGFYTEINRIIMEELPAFFGGQKTVEEVAGIIQNRATTYMNENK